MKLQVVLQVLADGAFAAFVNVAAGATVMPCLASTKLRQSLAATLRALGHSVSGYSGGDMPFDTLIMTAP